MIRHTVLTILIAVSVSGARVAARYTAPANRQALDTGPIVLDMVYNNLGESPRVSSFNDPKTLAAWGYTGQVPHLYVQCQREYEGKGSHPNYIARGVIEGFEELTDFSKPQCLRDISNHPNFAGVWTWTRGGGWKGPYIKNEFWCALNGFVLSQWALNPARSEEDIFREFAQKELELRGDDIDLFRELCLLSAQGVLCGQYSLLGGVSIGWNRDQYMGGLQQLGGNFNSFIKQGKVQEVLAEKEEAITVWRCIETLSKQINVPDMETNEFIETSCTYGRIKYEIIARGWTVMLLGMVGDKAGRYEKPRMAAALASYDRLWQEWKQLEASSSSCSTIYKNHYCRYVSQKGMFPALGMNDSVDKYRHIVSDSGKHLTGDE